MTEYEILDRINNEYSRILGENLVGIYVHGSIAFGCFNWNKSDIDFMVVVDKALTLAEKEALIRVLLELDAGECACGARDAEDSVGYSCGACPPKGLEMSVVQAKVCRPFVYPTPYELHFSNSHKEQYRADICGYCKKQQGVDPDLAAHFTVIHDCGIVLAGKPISEVFEPVPVEAYLDSIKNDISGAETEILENPVYIILNLCRVLAYIRERKVLSKAQGGDWGCENLPEKYREIVAAARSYYSGNNTVMTGSPEALCEFARFMLGEISAGM